MGANRLRSGHGVNQASLCNFLIMLPAAQCVSLVRDACLACWHEPAVPNTPASRLAWLRCFSSGC